MTTRLGYRPGLDELRGVAVALVVLGHSFPWGEHGGRVAWAGGVGVTVFFVLSGFLITRLLLEEKAAGRIDLRAFYGRRARRLLPALPLALALCAVTNMLTGGLLLEPLIGSFTYSANYLSLHDDWGAFGHLWSLAVEEHFYFVWPALVATLPRRILIAGIVVAVPIVAWLRFVEADASLGYRSTHLRIDAMLVGAALAFVVHRLPRVHPALVVAAVVGCAYWVPHRWESVAIRQGILPVALCSAILVAAALRRKRAWKPLVELGRISYGVYLFHLPVGMLLHHYGQHGISGFILTAAFAIVLADVSYRRIEQRWRLRRLHEPDAEHAGIVGEGVGRIAANPA